MVGSVIVDGKEVTSLEEYLEVRQHRLEFDDDRPYAAVFLLADSSLLFWKEGAMDWIHRIKCELPTRALTYDGYEAEVKAAYVGCLNGDRDEYYEIFRAAMKQIDIEGCMHIKANPTDEQRAHLEQSDIIFIAGGDIKEGWRHLDNTYLGESVKWRYYDGAVLVGVAEGATILGKKAWWDIGARAADDQRFLFNALSIVPVCVACNDTGNDEVATAVVKQGGPGTVALGIPRGGGVIFNTDGSFEPVKTLISDIHYHYENPGPHVSHVAPPAKGDGVMVAVERFNRRVKRARELASTVESKSSCADGVDEADDEPEPEPHLERAESLKQLGNDAFKKGDYAVALQLYRDAQLCNRGDEKICLNIAACLLKLRKGTAANDCFAVCNQALHLTNGKSAKAWYRRAQALKAKGDLVNSYYDLREAAVLEPQDKVIKDELAAATESLPEDAVMEAVAVQLDEAFKNAADVLSLGGAKLGPIGAKALCERLRGSSLSSIDLSRNWLRPVAMLQLGRTLSMCHSLYEVDLTHNSLLDRGLADLIKAGLLMSETLGVLRLGWNAITDAPIESLAEVLKENTALRDLSLEGNKLGFAAVQHLSAMLRVNKTLERLSLKDQQHGLKADALWRLISVCSGHDSMMELDVRGVGYDTNTLARLDHRMRHARCLVKVGKSPLSRETTTF